MPDLVLRLLLVAAILVVATLVWLLLQRGRGELRASRRQIPDVGDLSEILDAPPGSADRPTVVQFSSPVCSPCRAAARTWRSLDVPVNFLEIDVTTHEEIAARHGILRTPTSLVFDARGRPLGRISGAPTVSQATAALTEGDPP